MSLRARLLVSIPATPTTAGIDSRLLAIVLLGLVVVSWWPPGSARCWPGWSAAPWASWPPRGGVLGVLSLYDREDGEPFTLADDEALYEAKLQGRDRVVTAGPRLLPLAARPGQAGGRAARVE